MAKAREDWMQNVADSMDDKGRADAPTIASSTEKQRDGRRRLEAGALIRVDRIGRDPNQPRTEFDEEALVRLAESLKERGQLQPIRVRWDEGSGRYMVVTGERRWRAAQLAGIESLACVVMNGPATAEDVLEDQLIENCLREDLKPIEQARAYKSLMDGRGLSQRQLAERLQIGHPAIAKALALLNLPDSVQGSVERGEIAPGTAYELSKVGDAASQAELASRVVSEGLSRAETVEVVKRASKPKTKGRGASKAKKVTSRVFRSPSAIVNVELRKGSGVELIRAALVDALNQFDASRPAADQAAA